VRSAGMCTKYERGLPEILTIHLRDVFTAIGLNFDASMSGPALTETLRPHLGPELVYELVDLAELQRFVETRSRFAVSDLRLGPHEQVCIRQC
jgi:hypothetical protein